MKEKLPKTFKNYDKDTLRHIDKRQTLTFLYQTGSHSQALDRKLCVNYNNRENIHEMRTRVNLGILDAQAREK